MPHICVCICTYKRPELLTAALEGIRAQDTGGLFTFSAVVVDNDSAESGRGAVEAICRESSLAVKYCVEPRQNIAMARNKAVANADGDFIAFIDDDEVPIGGWLLTMYQTLTQSKADGVLGPVNPHFDDDTPQWVIKGRFYDRPTHPTGMVLEWPQCRTGNVLFRREVFAGLAEVFRPEFLSGEDQDFFKRMIKAGRVFIWCHEAPAYEVVPPVRWRRGFLVRRAVMRGVFSYRNRPAALLPLARSAALAPVYVVVLPIALVLGQAMFMKCIFKLAYHLGRLMALVGINPIKTPYVTE